MHRLFHAMGHAVRPAFERGLKGWQGLMMKPRAATAVLLATGVLAGVGMQAGVNHWRGGAAAEAQAVQLRETEALRQRAQSELNAMSARVAELQAEQARLNALGQRLTELAELPAKEFDFAKPVGQGGPGPVSDIAPRTLAAGIDGLEAQMSASRARLGVLENLLRTRNQALGAMPIGLPIAGSYITSGFGGRADPLGGGEQFHKGIDFAADLGDPVLAVADGVVSYSGERSGYGNVIEVDHGNGYVTRYAHNSRLNKQVGELVRAGTQVAEAGSTGRSTGVHVHFEVWQNGGYVNPSQFLGKRKPTQG